MISYLVLLLILVVSMPLRISSSDCDGTNLDNNLIITFSPPTTTQPTIIPTTEEPTTITTTKSTTSPTTTTREPSTIPPSNKDLTVASDSCSSTTTCSTTTTTCSSTEPTPTNLKNAVKTLLTLNDCTSLSDGTIMVDGRHCRRFYICQKGRAKRARCSISQWFDRGTLTCRDRSLVTNCPMNRT